MRKRLKSLETGKWRTASFRFCSLLLLTLQGDPGCVLCKLYWNCIGINHMPEGSMACSLANDAVWYDGKEEFFKTLPPLIIFTTDRLNFDLTLVLYSDFDDLCCHVTESKGKMLGWIHIQPVITHLKVFRALHLNNARDFCKLQNWEKIEKKSKWNKNLFPEEEKLACATGEQGFIHCFLCSCSMVSVYTIMKGDLDPRVC